MVSIWKSGFESEDPTFPYESVSEGNIFEITSEYACSGSQGLRASTPLKTGFAVGQVPLGEQQTISTRIPMIPLNFPTVDWKYFQLYRLIGYDSAEILTVTLIQQNGDLIIQLAEKFPTEKTLSYTFPSRPSPSQPCSIEIEFTKATDGGYRVYWNDEEIISDVGLDTSTAPDPAMAYMGIRWTNYEAEIVMDDVEIATEHIGSSESPQPNQYVLSVSSNLINVPFTLLQGDSEMSYETPWSGTVEEGTYEITMPETVQVGEEIYNFQQWDDGDTNLTKIVNLTEDTDLLANFELVSSTPKPSIPIKPIIGAIGCGTVGYVAAGNIGLAVGTTFGTLVGIIAEQATTLYATRCEKCGKVFSYSSPNTPVWCPSCGQEHLIKS